MLKVLYVATDGPKKLARKQTEKELIHELAIATIANRRIHDERRAKKLFAARWAALKEREREINAGFDRSL